MKVIQSLIIENERQFYEQCSTERLGSRLEDMLEGIQKSLVPLFLHSRGVGSTQQLLYSE